MDMISFWDALLIKTSIAGLIVAYGLALIGRLRKKTTNDPPIDYQLHKPSSTQQLPLPPTRSIKTRLDQTARKCIIFYGSQTGTAERFALQFAKNANAKFGLTSVVADLDDFNYADLKTLGSDRIAVFILATYGEGAPTDNAMDFDQFLKTETTSADGQGLDKATFQLQYAIFGLGNSSYRQYNQMATRTDTTLRHRGASRLGQVGIGDDGKGTLDDDFILWQDETLATIATRFGMQELEYSFKPDFEITESDSPLDSTVFLGEQNNAQRKGKIQGPFSTRNPLPAAIVEVKELFTSTDRNCLHLEFDVSGTSVTYDTGDHLALLPVNSDLEVHRFLRIFGLSTKANSVITISSNDPTLKVPLPPKTTYEAAARYYLDIAAPTPRQVLLHLSSFIHDGSTRRELVRLGSDATAYNNQVSRCKLNLAQILSSLSDSPDSWPIPFSFLLESIPPLRPRYYSISSSSLVDKKKISITAVVESATGQDWPFEFKGVATNYLLALGNKFTNQASTAPLSVRETHRLEGPRDKFSQSTAFISVRRSTFRLPKLSSTPIIMIGPGTGVAPFRGFIRERSFQAERGNNVGKTMLFYGCRSPNEDFLYKEEWKKYEKSFPPGVFSIDVAFSRTGAKKTYVQNLLKDHATQLKDLIFNQGAHVYICGNASAMAKDVYRAFGQILSANENEESGLETEKYLESMKDKGRWLEDVW